MNWGDDVGIVRLRLAIDLLTKREKTNEEHPLRKAEQKKTMMARWRQAQVKLMAEGLR